MWWFGWIIHNLTIIFMVGVNSSHTPDKHTIPRSGLAERNGILATPPDGFLDAIPRDFEQSPSEQHHGNA
jgi:hypothetical protein